MSKQVMGNQAVSDLFRTGRMLLELVRFSHTIFALPFALLATLLAYNTPLPNTEYLQFRVRDFLGIILCMVFARTAAMAFNRIVDRAFDARNPRTARRHLPAGLISLRLALTLTLTSVIGFYASTCLFLPNWLPLALATPVIAWLLGYSYSKRFTSGAHLWLGLALSLAPICVWLALRGDAVLETPLDLLPSLVIAATVASWVSGFDIIYACQDYEFDRKAGLHSIPAKFGIAKSLRIAAALHGFTIVCLLLLPYSANNLGLGWLYWTAILVIGGLLVYEHSLVSDSDLERIGIAFFNVNAVISVVVLVAAAIDCFVG